MQYTLQIEWKDVPLQSSGYSPERSNLSEEMKPLTFNL